MSMAFGQDKTHTPFECRSFQKFFQLLNYVPPVSFSVFSRPPKPRNSRHACAELKLLSCNFSQPWFQSQHRLSGCGPDLFPLVSSSACNLAMDLFPPRCSSLFIMVGKNLQRGSRQRHTHIVYFYFKRIPALQNSRERERGGTYLAALKGQSVLFYFMPCNLIEQE